MLPGCYRETAPGKFSLNGNEVVASVASEAFNTWHRRYAAIELQSMDDIVSPRDT